jgi:hypothetical protein
LHARQGVFLEMGISTDVWKGKKWQRDEHNLRNEFLVLSTLGEKFNSPKIKSKNLRKDF